MKSKFFAWSERLKRFKRLRGEQPVEVSSTELTEDEMSELRSESSFDEYSYEVDSPSLSYTVYPELDEYSIEEPEWQTTPQTNPHVLCWISKEFKKKENAAMEYLDFKFKMDITSFEDLTVNVCSVFLSCCSRHQEKMNLECHTFLMSRLFLCPFLIHIHPFSPFHWLDMLLSSFNLLFFSLSLFCSMHRIELLNVKSPLLLHILCMPIPN